MSFIETRNLQIDTVSALDGSHSFDVLRLDLLHRVISGNKWFKLKKYLQEAEALGKETILTFGGAYSNHLVATAAAAKDAGFKSLGIIRGEKPLVLSHTLEDARNFGMKIYFLSREEYSKKQIPTEIFDTTNPDTIYRIEEGGYGPRGAEGAESILENIDLSKYTHIIAAIGTGTTLAGLINACSGQKIIGISGFKNNQSLNQAVTALLKNKTSDFTILHEYHFGGYAKYTEDLLEFMNEWYHTTGIPSDFVYTGKLFYAINDAIKKKYFPDNASLLIVHSGGLQGNFSLANGKLIF